MKHKEWELVLKGKQVCVVHCATCIAALPLLDIGMRTSHCLRFSRHCNVIIMLQRGNSLDYNTTHRQVILIHICI